MLLALRWPPSVAELYLLHRNLTKELLRERHRCAVASSMKESCTTIYHTLTNTNLPERTTQHTTHCTEACMPTHLPSPRAMSPDVYNPSLLHLSRFPLTHPFTSNQTHQPSNHQKKPCISPSSPSPFPSSTSPPPSSHPAPTTAPTSTCSSCSVHPTSRLSEHRRICSLKLVHEDDATAFEDGVVCCDTNWVGRADEVV